MEGLNDFFSTLRCSVPHPLRSLSSAAEKQQLFSSEFPKTCNSLLNVTLMGCKAVKRNKIKSLEFAQSLKWPLKYSTFHEHDRRERDDNSFCQEIVQELKMLDDHSGRVS